MALLTLVPPVGEPVSLAQMKLFARVDFPDDDTLWPQLITAARHWCEVYCQRRFLLRTMRLLMDFFPGYVDFKMAGQKVSSPFVSGSNAVLVGIRYAIALPYPRVRAVTAFQYQDQNGNPQQLIASTNYVKDLSSQPARLTPLFGEMWPVARVVINAVQVDYVTGYGGTFVVDIAQGASLITGATFPQDFAGLAISIPGAGAGSPAGALNTTIASVDGGGNATLAVNASTTVANATAYVGDPVPEEVQVAIMRHALWHYENRGSTPSNRKDFFDSLKSQLNNFRDLRL